MEAARTVRASTQVRDEITVVRRSDTTRAFVVNRVDRQESVNEINDRLTMGNNAHPARFLTQHFWKRLPIAKLERLSLLTLMSATKESFGAIGAGFDLLFLGADGPKWKHYPEDDPLLLRTWHDFEQSAQAAIYD